MPLVSRPRAATGGRSSTLSSSRGGGAFGADDQLAPVRGVALDIREQAAGERRRLACALFPRLGEDLGYAKELGENSLTQAEAVANLGDARSGELLRFGDVHRSHGKSIGKGLSAFECIIQFTQRVDDSSAERFC